MPYSKNHIKVKVPKMSGFDKSHRNTGTSYVGTLTPLLCDEVIPGTKCSLRLPINVQLPPLVSDTYMNLKYEVQAFFVPSRLLCASFESFFCDFPWQVGVMSPSTSASADLDIKDLKGRVPLFRYYGRVGTDEKIYKSALLDFLGFRIRQSSPSGDYNALPLLAYHLIWQEWYRNPRVQRPAFIHHVGDFSVLSGSIDSLEAKRLRLVSAPYTFFYEQFNSGESLVGTNAYFSDNPLLCKLADGHNLYDTRQRNFPLDYFTGARPSPQLGAPAGVAFEIPEGDTGTSISIAQIRAANSIQQFRERNGLPSPRLVDQVKARYNADLSDGIAQRPICIGSAKYDVSSRGIDQTAPSGSAEEWQTQNPFNSVASQYGRAQANGNDFIIDHFVANEPGYIIVLGSLVPEVSYTDGIDPMFCRYRDEGSITDMACALLQNVGDQPIRLDELNASSDSPRAIFGYQDRYADWMFKPNQVHGVMRESSPVATENFGAISSFVLQRLFTGNNVEISDAFLKIPEDYLDPVMTFQSDVLGFSYWYDCLVQYKVSMPLAEWSIPSLQDPAYEHGQTVNLRRNGQIF